MSLTTEVVQDGISFAPADASGPPGPTDFRLQISDLNERRSFERLSSRSETCNLPSAIFVLNPILNPSPAPRRSATEAFHSWPFPVAHLAGPEGSAATRRSAARLQAAPAPAEPVPAETGGPAGSRGPAGEAAPRRAGPPVGWGESRPRDSPPAPE